MAERTLSEVPAGDVLHMQIVKSQAARDVLAERWRQATGRWSPEHDDSHPYGELARAAAVYSLCGEGPPKPGVASELHQSRRWDFNILGAIWPSDWHFNPKDRRTNLVRAAALLLAEIERMDRSASKARVTNGRHGCERCDGEPECTCGVMVDAKPKCEGCGCPGTFHHIAGRNLCTACLPATAGVLGMDAGREVRRIVGLVEHAAMKLGNAQARDDRADMTYWRGVLEKHKPDLDRLFPLGVTAGAEAKPEASA